MSHTYSTNGYATIDEETTILSAFFECASTQSAQKMKQSLQTKPIEGDDVMRRQISSRTHVLCNELPEPGLHYALGALWNLPKL